MIFKALFNKFNKKCKCDKNFICKMCTDKEEKNIKAVLYFKQWANTEYGKIFMEYLINKHYTTNVKNIGTATETALFKCGQMDILEELIKYTTIEFYKEDK
jgi:hypothetical protein